MTHWCTARQVGEKVHFHQRRDTMQSQSGFTLVEVMIVVAIIGIILAIASLNFRQWYDKYSVESYTREIHSILMRARNDAATTNIQVRVGLAANQVRTHHDADGDGAVDAGERTTVNPYPRFTLTWGVVATIVFDRRGMTNNIQTLNITGYSPNAAPSVDCIVVAATRINMGRMTGGACVHQ